MHDVKMPIQAITLLVEEALASSAKRKKKAYRDPLRAVLRAYLTYVNSNLILSNVLDVGFHDWQDFTPFYQHKFLGIGKEQNEIEMQRKQVEQLFTIPFPDLAVRDTKSLMRAVNDKRVEDLRSLICDAVDGKVVFDEVFAKAVLSEVFQCERKAARWRNILGYVSIPLGFLPWIGTPAEKFFEEIVGTTLEKRIKKQHKWFYMLTDIAEKRY